MNTSDSSTGEKAALEPQTRPYRWGYFQGIALFPWSIFIILVSIASLTKSIREPWPYALPAAAMGILGLPLAFGLLWKRKFALPLVYAVFGLSVLLTAIQVSVATTHFANTDFQGSSIFEAELLLVWLLSLVYYRRRRAEFR